MTDFLFIFRRDENEIPRLSPEEMQADTQRWIDWISGIAAQGKLNNRGNRLERTGKVVRANGMVTDGPFMELKEELLTAGEITALGQRMTRLLKDRTYPQPGPHRSHPWPLV